MDKLTEANSQVWEAKFRSHPYGRYPSEEMVRFLARTFRGRQKSEPVRVLELGCGPGANLWAIAREGYQTAGIDFSPTAIRQAAERMAEEGLKPADLRIGHMGELPWPDGYFDAVIDIDSLSTNTWTNILAIMAESHRVLKKGGHFFGQILGTRTFGCGTGTVIDDHATECDVPDGVVAGSGIAHFFAEDEIKEILTPFDDRKIGWTHRNDPDSGTDVFYWVFKARKPG